MWEVGEQVLPGRAGRGFRRCCPFFVRFATAGRPVAALLRTGGAPSLLCTKSVDNHVGRGRANGAGRLLVRLDRWLPKNQAMLFRCCRVLSLLISSEAAVINLWITL